MPKFDRKINIVFFKTTMGKHIKKASQRICFVFISHIKCDAFGSFYIKRKYQIRQTLILLIKVREVYAIPRGIGNVIGNK